MQIPTKEVRNGDHDGKEVWICHYNQPDLDKKPLRNIPPTKCLIRSIDDLPRSKKVYYSHSYFSPISSKGKATSKVISPVDNTGYRARSGNPLFVFENYEECATEWNKQLLNVSERLQERIDSAAKAWTDKQSEVLSRVVTL